MLPPLPVRRYPPIARPLLVAWRLLRAAARALRLPADRAHRLRARQELETGLVGRWEEAWQAGWLAAAVFLEALERCPVARMQLRWYEERQRRPGLFAGQPHPLLGLTPAPRSPLHRSQCAWKDAPNDVRAQRPAACFVGHSPSPALATSRRVSLSLQRQELYTDCRLVDWAKRGPCLRDGFGPGSCIFCTVWCTCVPVDAPARFTARSGGLPAAQAVHAIAGDHPMAHICCARLQKRAAAFQWEVRKLRGRAGALRRLPMRLPTAR